MTDTTVFNCRQGRHKVIGLTPAGTLDGICVMCGRRGVTDARRLPTPAANLRPPAQETLL